MPELPEVETIRRGLEAVVLKKTIANVLVNKVSLRLPIPKDLAKKLLKQSIQRIERRGKYLLLKLRVGTLIIHLGMSGNIWIKPKQHPKTKHEHLIIEFTNQWSLRYKDPRRFGLIDWTDQDPNKYQAIKSLGIEPLDKKFTANYLYKIVQNKKTVIKQLIMDNKVVTGIGNIYASEVLFAAKINPLQPANQIPLKSYKILVSAIKRILLLAIKLGGTTIKDHTDSYGEAGKFQNKLQVYGRKKQLCFRCNTELITTKISQRSTFYCPRCQPNGSSH